MKKNIIIALLLLCSFGVATAQSTLKTAYFMDRMTTRHKLNPALMTEYGYFAIPTLGDVSFGVNSNLSIDKLLFPLDNGELATFAHPDVDSEAFLKGLNKNNVISQDLNLSLLAFGFHGFGGFNTFDLSVRETLDVNLPRSLFEFIVGNDNQNTVYDMAGTSIDLSAWAELAIGHSRKINENLTVGVKLKYLVGAADANVTLDQMYFSTNQDELQLKLHGEGNVAATGYKLQGAFDDLDFDDFDMSSGLNTGLGIDLGATYKWDRFNFSMALTDLGFIRWNSASTMEVGSALKFSGFDDLDFEDLEGSTEGDLDIFEDFADELSNPTFEPRNSYTTYLSANLNIGAEYAIIEDKISAGILSSTTFGSVVTTECMVVATLSPARWFDIAFSGTVSSYGSYCGVAMNLCSRIVNLYLGADCLVQGVNSAYIPYNSSNLNIKMGLSIPFGKIHSVN